MKNRIFGLSALAALLLVSAITATAQDFRKTYTPGPGGTISIRNVSGDIKISGYDGEGIQITAYKEGRDRDMVDVEDLSGGSRVDLRARYQKCLNCSINASINFEIQVPRSSNYNFDKIQTASGNVSVENAAGRFHLSTASGDVLVQDVRGVVNASTASGQMRVKNAYGAVKASTASGDVEVELARIEGTDNLVFSTASGDLNIKAPSDLDALVEMSTASGSIRTDFPIEVKRSEYSSGSEARGRLGSGARNLHISSASGNVNLTRL
ncbi:MAG TPA: DUF4097 family beta strand repeat-containing protein [Pyrinomonadaceae bacterium]